MTSEGLALSMSGNRRHREPTWRGETDKQTRHSDKQTDILCCQCQGIGDTGSPPGEGRQTNRQDTVIDRKGWCWQC